VYTISLQTISIILTKARNIGGNIVGGKLWKIVAVIVVAALIGVNLTGCKQQVQTAGVVVSPTTPAAPANLTADAVKQNSVSLQWADLSDDEEGFRIYRDSILIETVGANVVTYQDTGLKPATTYQYVVKAYNHVGESGACLCTVKTLNPPITVTLDKIGVISDHDPFLKGAGDIYLYVAVSDGKREPQLQRIPTNGIIKLKDNETTEIGHQIFYSDCVGDELKIVAIAFEQDLFGPLEKVLLGALLSYVGGDYGAGELIVRFLQGPPSTDEGMTGETPDDDFVGAIERIWTSGKHWGIGSYKDVRSGDLRLWFTIESSMKPATSAQTSESLTVAEHLPQNLTNDQLLERVVERLRSLAQTSEAEEYVLIFLTYPSFQVEYLPENKAWNVGIYPGPGAWDMIGKVNWFRLADRDLFFDSHWGEPKAAWIVDQNGGITPVGKGILVEEDIERLNTYRVLE